MSAEQVIQRRLDALRAAIEEGDSTGDVLWLLDQVESSVQRYMGTRDRAYDDGPPYEDDDEGWYRQAIEEEWAPVVRPVTDVPLPDPPAD